MKRLLVNFLLLIERINENDEARGINNSPYSTVSLVIIKSNHLIIIFKTI